MAFDGTMQRWSRRLGAILSACLIAVATQAGATPVDVFFNASGSGLSDQSIADFVAAGGRSLGTQFVFGDPNEDFLDITTPDRRDSTGITPNERGGPDFIANPAKASNIWMIDPKDAFSDLWLVFNGHSQSDPNPEYLSQNVGLNVDPMTDPWFLVTPELDPELTFLALYIGPEFSASDGPADDPALMPLIDYRVRQALLPDPSDPDGRDLLPQYLYSFIEDVPPPVAEPGAILLLGAGLLGLGARRARR